LKEEARRAARTDLPVLLSGESGTGKELFAQAIHQASLRQRQPSIHLNCAAIPKELFESELFGYAGGAFTGANSAGKLGKIELAHGGTLFLDEIGEMPLDLQPKLLRVLEDKTFDRVGGNQPIHSNFRIIAATNRDLGEMVKNKQFREDLFYRLAVVRVGLPPLRERLEDIPLLVTGLMESCSRNIGLEGESIPEFTPEAMALLREHPWKGNVRQLRNVVQTAMVLARGRCVTPSDLFMDGSLATASQHPAAIGSAVFSGKTLEEIEKEAIRETLVQSLGNKSRAARKLGIAYSTLLLKIKKYDP